MPFYRLFFNCIFFLLLLLSSGCATISAPPIDYSGDAVLETLSSEISLSIQASESIMGGRGYLIYKRPDQLHLLILSPFGTTIMEAFSIGDRVTLIYPSQLTAYEGHFDELPEKGGLQGWRLMKWVMDAPPHMDNNFSKTVERMSKYGFAEKMTYENGLITSKSNSSGDTVHYSKYSAVNGIPIAHIIDLRNSKNDSIRITLEEPELNSKLDDGVLAPNLYGMTILPFSAL